MDADIVGMRGFLTRYKDNANVSHVSAYGLGVMVIAVISFYFLGGIWFAAAALNLCLFLLFGVVAAMREHSSTDRFDRGSFHPATMRYEFIAGNAAEILSVSDETTDLTEDHSLWILSDVASAKRLQMKVWPTIILLSAVISAISAYFSIWHVLQFMLTVMYILIFRSAYKVTRKAETGEISGQTENVLIKKAPVGYFVAIPNTYPEMVYVHEKETKTYDKLQEVTMIFGVPLLAVSFLFVFLDMWYIALLMGVSGALMLIASLIYKKKRNN